MDRCVCRYCRSRQRRLHRPGDDDSSPEYEITVGDVQKINNAEYFLYAGYEVMMKSMGTTIKKDESALIHIQTNNSIENVRTQSAKLAAIFGTEAETRFASRPTKRGFSTGKSR